MWKEIQLFFYSRSQQTVVSETREGSTYSQSVAITGTAYVEDIEEIPAPKFTPVFEPLSVGDKDKPTEVYFDLETTGFGKLLMIFPSRSFD